MTTLYGRTLTVFDEWNELKGDAQSLECEKMRERIELEIAKIPEHAAPTYVIPPPPDPPKPEETEEDDEMIEYAEILNRLDKVQRKALDQMGVVNKIQESEMIMRETMDMQRVLLRRIVSRRM